MPRGLDTGDGWKSSPIPKKPPAILVIDLGARGSDFDVDVADLLETARTPAVVAAVRCTRVSKEERGDGLAMLPTPPTAAAAAACAAAAAAASPAVADVFWCFRPSSWFESRAETNDERE